MAKKKPQEIHIEMKKYINDLRAMSKDAYVLCDGNGKDCKTCDRLLECMNGLRNAIGDLGESLAWTMEQIAILDDTISISMAGTQDFLEKTGIEVDGMKELAGTKKRKKKNKITNDIDRFYT